MNETEIIKNTSIKEIYNIILDINKNNLHSLLTIKKDKNILYIQLGNTYLYSITVRKDGVNCRHYNEIEPNLFSHWLESYIMSYIAFNIDMLEIDTCIGKVDVYNYITGISKSFNDIINRKNFIYRFLFDPRKLYKNICDAKSYEIIKSL